ncbi:MAG: TIGR01777 family protein [Deltaproteobacteria bacterium]|nr:MAG: TIGR01777 family protein [Deltaproteobacteria bacterium]
MKIMVTGGTGFVGASLIPALTEAGHEVILLVRRGEPAKFSGPKVEVVEANTMAEGVWQERVKECLGAINLAGAPINTRWNKKNKELIRDSRVLTTRNLVSAIPENSGFRLLSTSAVGYYGDGGEALLSESAPPGDDFLASVAKEWEEEALAASKKGVKVAITRFGIVLDSGGGALEKLEALSRKFLGGPLGNGRQWFSWIHRADLVRALLFLLDKPEIEGPVNLSAPSPVRQLELMRVLGRALKRPSFTPAPSFAIRLLLGDFADVLLFSQRMDPLRLREAGFQFEYPTIESAVSAIYG